MSSRFFILLGCLLAAPVHAEIYKYVDENGRVTFSDVYRKGAQRIEMPGAPAALPSASSKTPKQRAAYKPSPADFPRIDPDTQRRRDDIRRQVLEDEIAAERRNVDEARRQLSLGERLQAGEKASDTTYVNRVKRLRETLSQHEQNIGAIQRELANLK